MTHSDLKQAILAYMRELYKAEFVGGLKIQSLEPTGYRVTLYLDNPEVGVDIISDLSDEEFLPFIKEELRKKKFNKTKYFKTIKLY